MPTVKAEKKASHFRERAIVPVPYSFSNVLASIESQCSKDVDWACKDVVRMALGEHASIASFALLSQKLLMMGAPDAMVDECLVCAREEVTEQRFVNFLL